MRSGENCSGREAPHCAGPWLGGLVGSGNLVALNRWTTDSQGTVASGGLYVLSGSRLKSVASGAGTVEAAAADGGRVAVLRTDGTVVLYSSSGKQLRTVSPASAKEIALSGHNLVVLSKTRTLALYDTRTGSLVRTLSLPPHTKRAPANLDLQGKIAIYTVGPLHGVNLSSGKDRVLADPRGGVDLARIDDAGVAYAGNGRGASYDKGTLVFVPLAGVVAKGSG
jgi:WD40 repeat protein